MPKNKTNIPKQTNAMQSLPIKIVEQVVENQTREIEFRTNELALRQLQEKNALEYSNKAWGRILKISFLNRLHCNRTL
jgi:hypothetical protein